MRSIMARTVFGSGVLLAAACMVAVAQFATAQDAAPAADAQTVAAGKYLAAAGDCVACHTTPGGQDFAGGTVIETPFGNLLGPNITPDKTTGIGNWTDDQFVRAVKFGRGHNGQYLYPGLPYVYFNKVSRDDILKIRAYLNTIPAVDHDVKSNQLPFPYNIRLSLFFWNTLFFPNSGDFKPDPSQSAEWNRGAYLVQGLGHCAACHTPKNFLGGDKTGQELQGALLAGANAPSLVSTPNQGLGLWSADDVAAYLQTGHNKFADSTGPMADVITNSTSHLTLADNQAIGVYLKSLPGNGAPAPAPIAANDPGMVAGAHIYADECAACHTNQGTGVPNLIPALKGNPVVTADNPVSSVQMVLHGGQSVSTIAAAGGAMPPFSYLLNDQQVADVLTYVRNNWGNAAPAVPSDLVAKNR